MKIGVDLGGSHIGIGLINESGEVVEKFETDLIQIGKDPQNILQYVDSSLSKLIKTVDIKKIGIAAPGNPKGKKITNLVNLGVSEIDFTCIEEKFKIPIQTINDAKAAALAEKYFGAMRGIQDSVYLCLGTGIGGAVFLQDHLLQANENPGFEVGHMIIQKDGKSCHCGKKGCFETYCSVKRLKERVIPIVKQFSNVNLTDSKKLVEELELYQKEPEITEIIQEYIDYLIVGLSNIIDLFEPQLICLGGSFVYFQKVIFDPFLQQFFERKYVFNRDRLPKIVLAQLKNDAGMIGATISLKE